MCSFNESVVNAKVFANYFRDVCTQFVSPIRDPNTHKNLKKWNTSADILSLLTKIKESITRGKCDEETFKNEVIKINRHILLQMEIWWYMMRCDIMSPDDFNRIFDSNDCTYIGEHILISVFNVGFLSSDNSFLMKNIASDFIEIIVKHKDTCQLKNQSHMYKSLFDCVTSHTTDNNVSVILNGPLADVLQLTSIDRNSKKLFLLHILDSFLKGKTLSHDDIVLKSELYLKNIKMSYLNKTVKILQFLNVADIVLFLKNALTEQSKSLHYENLFDILSCTCRHFKATLKPLKNVVPFVLDKALQNLNDTLLQNVFILARHCSFPLLTNSPTYLQWFASTFSSESTRPINTKEKSEFFLKFLTKNVTYESAYYLKVHINRVPFLPIECHSMLSDYVQIVKTRLLDLNESFDLGLFDNTTDKTCAEFDVETILNIFAATGEVPKSVLEASLFCKEYYEKKFMVNLLSKYEGKNSVRHRLVMKLKKLGKVPNTLLSQYNILM